MTSLGQPLGALCIIDRVARPPLTSAEKALLTGFAALAASYMDQRLMEAEAGKSDGVVRGSVKNLGRYAAS